MVAPLPVHLLPGLELIIVALEGLRLHHLQALPPPHHAHLPPHLLQVVQGPVVAPVRILQNLQESSPGLELLRSLLELNKARCVLNLRKV